MALIPFRNLTSNIEMRKIRQGTETLRIISKSRKSLTEHLCDTFERGKTAVVKVFFTQFVPDMLDGIEFGAVGRLGIRRIFSGTTRSFARCQPAPSTCMTMKCVEKTQLTSSRKRFIIAVEASGKINETIWSKAGATAA
jgi:hypothetical protein